MKINELAETVSRSTGVAEDSVKRVLNAAFAVISKQMERDEPVKLLGLGTFMRRRGKVEGQTRVVFRRWPSEAEKQARKEKKKEKRAKRTEAEVE